MDRATALRQLGAAGWFRDRPPAERQRVEALLRTLPTADFAASEPAWRGFPWQVLAAVEVEIDEEGRDRGTPERYASLLKQLAAASDGLLRPDAIVVGATSRPEKLRAQCDLRGAVQATTLDGLVWPDPAILKLANRAIQQAGGACRFVAMANVDPTLWRCAFVRPVAYRRALALGLVPSDQDAHDGAFDGA